MGAFDPVQAGNKLMSEWNQAKGQRQQQQDCNARQKDKLMAQGFITVEAKQKDTKRSTSSCDGDDTYSGLTSAAADRLKVLEKITAGGNSSGYTGNNRRRYKRRSMSGPVDHALIAEALARAKAEKQAAEDAKTRPGGGRVIQAA